nr:uncharacterized protein LOC129012220 isoform X2 [Pongo pygmaeus]XP_054303676.1 uncharacterized protein LOC129012220 isoform X2 [Pongo pygmaeus]XP_054303677.1 uncharacterized protein LOC129012220 isoform X2 [Pongo pygmaeus]XP_054303678.1 uncharacterized protein LOC129012220 isoform X2 [Pongo pygmaeus]
MEKTFGKKRYFRNIWSKRQIPSAQFQQYMQEFGKHEPWNLEESLPLENTFILFIVATITVLTLQVRFRDLFNMPKVTQLDAAEPRFRSPQDILKRISSVNQEEGPFQTLNLLAPCFWTFQPPEL